VDRLSERFGVPLVDWNRVERLVSTGHLARDGTRIAATSEGRLLLDSILGEIAADEPKALAVAG
jgi:coproporphyrinogen III oxidase-like Fe-S oxidoreductase